MKRVNFRSFVYSALLLMLTVLSSLIALNIPWLGFIMLVLLIFVPISIAIVRRKNIVTYKFVTIILTSCLCFTAILLFFVRVYTWIPSEITNDTYWISGIVDDNYVVNEERVVVLKNIRLDNVDVDGKMQLTVYDEGKFFHLVPEGDRLEFAAYVFTKDLVDGFTVKASYLRSNIRYSASVNASNVTISKGETNLLDRINSYVKTTLIESMGNRYGVIAYGILTGDKNGISSSVRDVFSTAGIAHVLAVSGLHIGFLMAMATFILRKLKVKRLPTFIASGIILFLYSLFAGFSPSVVRASIMFLMLNGAMLLGEQNDSLNSLGFAITVILTVSPIMLFEAGFIMSAGAIFGIINFSPPLTKLLTKIKLPQKLAEAIAVPITAQLGILPAGMNFFGTLQLYSILVNIVLMPLITVTFTAVFVSLLLSIISPLRFLLTLSGFLIKGLIIAAEFCASLPFARLMVKSSLLSLAVYPLYFIVGGYFNWRHKRIVRVAGSVMILGIIVALILV